PEWRSTFEEALVQGVENVARDLAEAEKREPALFAFGAPRVKRVFCKYDAVAREDDVTMDAAAGEVTIAMPAKGESLIPRGAIYAAMTDAFTAELERRYANVEPEKADDPELYFDWLTDHHPRSSSTSTTALRDSSRATQIERAARLSLALAPAAAPKAGEKKSLPARVNAWLVSERDFFGNAYESHFDEALQAPAGSAFRKGEAAYVAWLNARFAGLDPAAQRQLLKSTAVKTSDRARRPGEGTYVTTAFAGFDWLGHAFAVVDAWIAAGHPVGRGPDSESDRRGLFDEIVAARPKDENGRRMSWSSTDHELYEYGLRTSAKERKRFLDFVLAKHDALFTEAVMINVRELRGGDDTARTIAVWRSFDGDEATWRAAAAVVGEDADRGEKRLLVDELAREWKAYPQRRGELLYLFTRADRYGNAVDWPRFAEQSGAPISQAEFTAFVGSHPNALAYAKSVWPALERKFARADAIVPRLDAFVDAPIEGSSPSPESALGAIVHLLCDEGHLADLGKIHGWIQSRVAFHPGDAKRFSTLLDDTREGSCKVKTPPAPKKPKGASDLVDPFSAQARQTPAADDDGTPFGPPQQ
ncbi:MAG TPA: hypothetical protein VF407_06610, partial [Polyangiaceae bacterium]